MKYTIIGGAPELPDIEKIDKSSVIICADKGYDHCVSLNLKPHLVVGDLDSVANKIPSDIGLIVKDEQENTDTYLAVHYAKTHGATKIDIFSCMGGRFDHTMGNVSILLFCIRNNIKARLISKDNEAFIISNQEISLKNTGRKYFSLFPIFCDTASGVSIKNAKYLLDNVVLSADHPIAVSNEFEENDAIISVKSGNLLIVLSSDIF